MDDVTWAGLTLTLTLLGAAWTWYAFRRRGLASGLRGAGLALLPLAALLTGTLRMFARIVDAVADWALSLAFSPRVWVGVVLAAVAVCLLVASSLAARGRRHRSVTPSTGHRPVAGPAGGRGSGTSGSGDPELDEIEALLRRRGIT